MQYIASVGLSMYITSMKISRRALFPFFFLFCLTSALYAQLSNFTVMGNYVSSFEYKPDLRITKNQNTRHLFGGVVILEAETRHVSWGGGFRVRYKMADGYTVDIMDEQDSLTGETTEFEDKLTFLELFGTGSAALIHSRFLRFDIGADAGLIAIDRNFPLGENALNLQVPLEVMPWLRLNVFPRNQTSFVVKAGYILAYPYTETRITEYTEDEARVTMYKERVNLTGPTLEAGLVFRF
jgi:hypothetical protein